MPLPFPQVKHEILYDEVLLPWAIEWVATMSLSAHRGMRHTATEAAMAMMSTLSALKVEVNAACAGTMAVPAA